VFSQHGQFDILVRVMSRADARPALGLTSWRPREVVNWGVCVPFGSQVNSDEILFTDRNFGGCGSRTLSGFSLSYGVCISYICYSIFFSVIYDKYITVNPPLSLDTSCPS
jgi:hypothetical protein